MMPWKSFAVLTLMSCFETHASLYQCKEENGKPYEVEVSQQRPQINYVKVSPHIFEETKKSISETTKIPYLIYYVIDSAEPFMQLSVKYEMAELKKSCLVSEAVNFAALVNSLYANENSIAICKNKKFRKINLKTFARLNNLLKTKRNFLLEGDHTYGQMGPMSHLVQFPDKTKQPFFDSPLAHPDFLHDLVDLVMREKTLFPSTKYLPFLNLKSHGSARTVLSGLYSCQTKAKTLTQQTILKDFSTEEKSVLDNLLSGTEIKDTTLLEKTLKRLHLDRSYGKGLSHQESVTLGDQALGDQALGDQALGDQALGDQALGSTIFGLGADDGLGSSSAFGVFQYSLNAVLAKLFNKENQRYLGFLMLESCETNRDISLNHSYLDNIGGVYTAKHSLWYRNLNWWQILTHAKNSSKDLIQLLEENTSKIDNLDIVK